MFDAEDVFLDLVNVSYAADFALDMNGTHSQKQDLLTHYIILALTSSRNANRSHIMLADAGFSSVCRSHAKDLCVKKPYRPLVLQEAA